MKNLVLGALLVAAASSAACTVSDPPPAAAVVTAHWSFSSYANRDLPPSDPCPVGFDTAAVHAREWDPVLGEYVPGGLEVVDLFDCSAKVGTTDLLDGIFLIWVEIEDGAGGIYAQSAAEYFDTLDGDATIELPTLFTDAGYLDLSWDLVDANNVNGPRLSCAEAGIGSSGSVSTTAVSVASPSFILIDKFDCIEGYGTSDVLPEDFYDVTVTASTGSSDIGASAPIPDVEITAPNGLTHLGHVRIPVQ